MRRTIGFFTSLAALAIFGAACNTAGNSNSNANQLKHDGYRVTESRCQFGKCKCERAYEHERKRACEYEHGKHEHA